MNIIPVKSAKQGEMPISRNTAYKWNALKKYPRLIYKVCGTLYFDMNEWEQMALNAQERNVRESPADDDR